MTRFRSSSVAVLAIVVGLFPPAALSGEAVSAGEAVSEGSAVSGAGAAEPTAGAEDPGAAAALAEVRKTLDAALEVVRGEGTREEKLASLRTVARDILDTRAMGRTAIGDALAAQSPPQQEEYFELFDHLIVRAYLQKLLLFRKPRFAYRKPRREGEVVNIGTKIVTAKDEYRVDYAMRQRQGRWAATDVIVEGISLARNYEAQFSSLLRDRSFAELLDLMRSKTRRVREEPE